ncbi:MAG: hypothetical protein WA999_16180 [Spirulinaceae cyanobacterium]
MVLPTVSRAKQPHLQLIGVISFLVAGTILRLLWAADMEWKWEEQWMFQQAQQIAAGAIPLPVGGIQSSIGIPNPGMGVWCFAVIAKFAKDPVAMVRGVQILNILPIWFFFGFVVKNIPKSNWNPWLWGLAIASVNPIAIVLSRKLWIPDIMAPFCLLIFLGHWFRKKFWGSFLWGIAAISSGQIHMGGFFLTLGLFCWTIYHDYHKNTLKKVAWEGWILGTIIGSIPFIFWLWEVFPQRQGSRSSILGLLVPKFYIQWLTGALGINLSYSLKDFFWSDFLREPLIFGFPTYLMIPAHLFLVGVGIYPFYRWFKSRNYSRPKKSELSFYLKAIGFGVGGAFTLAAVNVPPYYIAVVFPYPYLWLAKLYQNKIKILVVIALMQLLISFTFLSFIHRTGGIPFEGSGYGMSYRFQMTEKMPELVN